LYNIITISFIVDIIVILFKKYFNYKKEICAYITIIMQNRLLLELLE